MSGVPQMRELDAMKETQMNRALSGTGLSKNFGAVRALSGVDIHIPSGQALAIMGPSGSGKSTLLHCLSGIMRPSGGDVRLGSEPVSSLSDAQRSRLRLRNFGFVFQDGQLIPELSAEAARHPGEVSGGQAQRIAIARALITSPAVVFADEPTGALDQATGHEVMQILTTTTRMTGATLVVVTHDLQVARWCDRLVEIRDGRIHADSMQAQQRTGLTEAEGAGLTEGFGSGELDAR